MLKTANMQNKNRAMKKKYKCRKLDYYIYIYNNLKKKNFFFLIIYLNYFIIIISPD